MIKRKVFLIILFSFLIACSGVSVVVEVVDEESAPKKIAETSEDTYEQTILKKIYPIDCISSQVLSDEYSCENLYDLDTTFWSDNTNSCNIPTWIEFTFENEIFLEFIVIENIEDSDLFNTRFNIKDFRLRTYNEGVDESPVMRVLENDNISQWFDINETITKLKLEVFSTYPPTKYLDLEDTKSCVLQEIAFYGRST